MTQLNPAQRMSERTQDAYSHDRYQGEWGACVALLLARGFTEEQTEAILRSKHMRWAADEAGEATAGALSRYIDDPRVTRFFEPGPLAELSGFTE